MAERYRRATRDAEGLGSRLVTEGAGVAVGFGVAGLTGYTIESKFKPDITTTSPASDKFMAWAYNNGPKALLWLAMKMKEPRDVRDITDEAYIDAEKGVVGSIGVDTALRVINNGAPPDMATGKKILTPADRQKLIQENSALRAELNKALQHMSAWRQGTTQLPGIPAVPVRQTPPVPARYQPAIYQPVPSVPPTTAENPAARRQREHGFMNDPAYSAPPMVDQREKKYGFMTGKNDENIAAMFNMR